MAEKSAQKSDMAFRTISEVADELGVQPHVLRFWETKFHQIAPMKRGGGRRFYRPADVELLRRIKSLLHTEGYTIKGVQRMLSHGGVKNLPPAPGAESEAIEQVESVAIPAEKAPGTSVDLAAIVGELEEIRDLLKKSAA
ncbi:MerR family transcriptional regulator [Pseudomonadota bacterium]